MVAFIPKNFGDRTTLNNHWYKPPSMKEVVARTLVLKGQICGHIIKFEIEGNAEVIYWDRPEPMEKRGCNPCPRTSSRG